MSTQSPALQIRGLGKQKMAAVRERAKRLGMTPQRYLRHLVEEDLAISERAKKSSFAQLLGPGQEADEGEIDQLVEAARNEYYHSKRRKD
jgi:ABC-type uncharacterized transport system ATPase subunit